MITLIEVLILFFLFIGLISWSVIRQDKKLTDKEKQKYSVFSATVKKKEEERSFDKLLKDRERESIERAEREEVFNVGQVILMIILWILYIYFMFPNPEKKWGFAQYFFTFILIGGTLDTFLKYLDRPKAIQQIKKDFKNNSNIKSQYPQTSFDDFVSGRMSLVKCFWFYHVLIGFVLSFLCVYFAEMYQQYWLYIFPLAYYAVVTVAVWNSATLYRNEKLQNKQPYSWAIAAKIFISFNAIVLVGQTIVILNTK